MQNYNDCICVTFPRESVFSSVVSNRLPELMHIHIFIWFYMVLYGYFYMVPQWGFEIGGELTLIAFI